MNITTPAKLLPAAALAAVLALSAGCTSKASGDASAAKSAGASVTANPTVSAEISQGRMLVKSCFTGTPLQQVHQVHLVFLSSATGKNGPAVVAARDKTFSCLGINDPAKRTAFTNAAITAAEHAHLGTKAGRTAYFEVTLPELVLANGGTAAGMGTSTAQPAVPGTTTSGSPS